MAWLMEKTRREDFSKPLGLPDAAHARDAAARRLAGRVERG
ncbi:MAG TPA: hypothetical protein VF535_11710 [Allosphingosinicella sp.]|jgi:hypothetical protein